MLFLYFFYIFLYIFFIVLFFYLLIFIIFKLFQDAFMVAFENPEKAVHWCVAVQEELMRTNWPSKLFDNENAKEEINQFSKKLQSGVFQCNIVNRCVNI